MKLIKWIKNFPSFKPSERFNFLAAGAICYIAIIIVIILFVFPKIESRYKVGDVAQRDYSAPYDVEFVNSLQTDVKRQEALSSLQTYYMVDENRNQVFYTQFNDFFDTLKTLEQPEDLLSFDPLSDFRTRNYWQAMSSAGINSADISRLIELSDDKLDNLRQELSDVQVSILSQPIGPKQVDTLQSRIMARLRSKGIEPQLQRVAEKILTVFTGENTIIDIEKTNTARDNVLSTFQPVTEKIIKGEVYLREGDRINDRHLDILNTIFKPEPRKEARNRLKKIITLCLLVLAGFVIFWYFMGRLPVNPLLDNRLYFIFLIQTLITVLGGVTLSRLATGNDLSYYLLVPLVVNAWVITYFISPQASLLSTLFHGAFFALAFSLDRTFLLTSMISGAISSFLIKRDCRHGEIFRGIIFVGLIGTLANIAVILLYNDPVNDLLRNTRIIWFSAIAAVPLMIALSWLYVFAFRIVTWYYLNELSDVNNPLIRQLRHNSPGSYHHSLMVGDIGEIAAEAIGANGLLVRVAALYHDIGKAKMPHFYIENQARNANPHDRYPPSLSRLIVLSHVKDGVQIAKKAGLPREIIDGIQQHQGTTLMKYFFRKALAKSDGNPVDEYDYRYEGPTPQYPEMAILALADSVESAVRSLDEPTPHRIKVMVDAIFQERLLDGQFDDSQLTISELNDVKDSLIDTLSGIYHSRIEYPDVKELKQQFEEDRQEKEMEAEKKKDISLSDTKNDRTSSKDNP